MNDNQSLQKSLYALLDIVGFTINAVEKFKGGKNFDGFVNVAKGAGTIIFNWSDLKTSYYQVNNFVQSVMPDNIEIERNFREIDKNLALMRALAGGKFAGKWESSDKSITAILYHDGDNNTISLRVPKASGNGHNMYEGGYSLQKDLILLTGKNGIGEDLVIVGNSNYDNQSLQFIIWKQNPGSGKSQFDGALFFNKIKVR